MRTHTRIVATFVFKSCALLGVFSTSAASSAATFHGPGMLPGGSQSSPRATLFVSSDLL